MLHYYIIAFITFLTAFTGSLITEFQFDWYNTINLPSWTPSGIVIGSVWTAIFILSGISAMLVWNLKIKREKKELISRFFLINAVLNIFWTYLFFALNDIGWAFAEMFLLNFTIIYLIVIIWPVSRLAAALLIPYTVWVTFTTYLTYVILLLNSLN